MDIVMSVGVVDLTLCLITLTVNIMLKVKKNDGPTVCIWREKCGTPTYSTPKMGTTVFVHRPLRDLKPFFFSFS